MENSSLSNTLRAITAKKRDPSGLLGFVAGTRKKKMPAEKYAPLHRPRNLFLKRSFDLLFATVSIPALIIVLPFIAFFIKIGSKGPVFFLQKRNKKDGRVFTCIKFRTMTATNDGAAKAQCVTRAGLLLRKYHLDELPQLLNVWWGDMSLIGPRPHMITDNEKFDRLVENYAARHTVKPGITGLAQVQGYIGPVEAVEDIRQRVGSDIFYIRNWSPALDARIICLSFLCMTGLRRGRRTSGYARPLRQEVPKAAGL